MQQYKAAIALNNSAVTMLQRRQYEDALETWKDCVWLMRSAVLSSSPTTSSSSSSSSSPCPPKVTEQDIDQAMRKAWKRSAMQRTDGTSSSAIPLLQERGNFVLKISSRQLPSEAQVMLANLSNGSFGINDTGKDFCCCISIEPLDYDDSSYWENVDWLDLDSNIMLYNYGIAHCALAAELETTAMSGNFEKVLLVEMRQSGFHLFRLCEIFLRSRLSRHDSGSFLHSQCNIILLFSLLLTRTLIQLSFQLHCAATSVQYCDTLTALLTTIDSFQRLMPNLVQQAAAA